jgi:hypothetical protein
MVVVHEQNITGIGSIVNLAPSIDGKSSIRAIICPRGDTSKRDLVIQRPRIEQIKTGHKYESILKVSPDMVLCQDGVYNKSLGLIQPFNFEA